MKQLLVSLTPPFLTKLLKQLFQAIKIIRDTSQIYGYSNQFLVRTVVSKTVEAKKRIFEKDLLAMESFRIAFAALSCEQHPESVLDFGGGAGYQYFNLSKITDKRYKWSIIETNELVLQARQNTALREINFYESLEDFRSSNLEEVDLLYCSRALQYLLDPIATCRQMNDLLAKNIYITGVTLSPDLGKHELTQISLLSSNGPGPLPEGISDHQVSYDFQLIPEESILEVFSEKYELKYRTSEEPVVHIHKNIPISYNGFFFTRRDLR
jgi:putative methyltransferase (TIGR04325 family)